MIIRSASRKGKQWVTINKGNAGTTAILKTAIVASKLWMFIIIASFSAVLSTATTLEPGKIYF